MFINTQQQDNSMQQMFAQVLNDESWKLNKSKVNIARVFVKIGLVAI
jgi:hypothetical protein